MIFNFSQKKLALTSLFSAVTLSILAWLIKTSPALQRIDNESVVFFSQMRNPFSNNLFLFISYFGSESFIISSCLFLAVIFFIYKKTPHYFLFLGTILATSNFIYFLKLWIDRSRPEIITPAYQEVLSSFPSGHAVLSIVFYGLLAYLYGKTTEKKSTQQNLFAGWIFIFILIGYSRLHLGVHFLSDVLAGYAAGFFILPISIIIFERLFSSDHRWWQILRGEKS